MSQVITATRVIWLSYISECKMVLPRLRLQNEDRISSIILTEACRTAANPARANKLLRAEMGRIDWLWRRTVGNIKQKTEWNLCINWLTALCGGINEGASEFVLVHTVPILAQSSHTFLLLVLPQWSIKNKRDEARQVFDARFCFRDSASVSGGMLQHFFLVHSIQRGRSHRDNHHAQQSRYNLDVAHRMCKPLCIPPTTFF